MLGPGVGVGGWSSRPRSVGSGAGGEEGEEESRGPAPELAPVALGGHPQGLRGGRGCRQKQGDGRRKGNSMGCWPSFVKGSGGKRENESQGRCGVKGRFPRVGDG